MYSNHLVAILYGTQAVASTAGQAGGGRLAGLPVLRQEWLPGASLHGLDFDY